jgi:hypothetical protein
VFKVEQQREIMSPLAIASIAFVCIFGGGMLGLLLRSLLPEHHLNEDSIGVVKLGVGLIATLSALVLGLLIASAKGSYDRVNDEFHQTAVDVIMLDRALANYGSETRDIRQSLRQAYGSATDLIFSSDGKGAVNLDTPKRLAQWEQFQKQIRELVPQNDLQRSYQSDALALYKDLARARWLIIEQGGSSMPTPFLVVLVVWLAIIFTGFGLVTAKNSTVVTVLFLCSLSVAGSIFLIEEMNRPLQGLMKISDAPMRNALTHLGQ